MKILTVYFIGGVTTYREGVGGVTEIKAYTVNGYFWYWQVIFQDNYWLDITAPCILEHRPRT